MAREVREEDSKFGSCEDKEEEVRKFPKNYAAVTEGQLQRVIGQLRLEGSSGSL